MITILFLCFCCYCRRRYFWGSCLAHPSHFNSCNYFIVHYTRQRAPTSATATGQKSKRIILFLAKVFNSLSLSRSLLSVSAFYVASIVNRLKSFHFECERQKVGLIVFGPLAKSFAASSETIRFGHRTLCRLWNLVFIMDSAFVIFSLCVFSIFCVSLEIHEAKPTEKCCKIETKGQILLDNKKYAAELIFPPLTSTSIPVVRFNGLNGRRGCLCVGWLLSHYLFWFVYNILRSPALA